MRIMSVLDSTLSLYDPLWVPWVVRVDEEMGMLLID